MLIGTLDPLEGSVLILLGIAFIAAGAAAGHRPERAISYLALVLAIVGVGLLFGISAVGGVGGNSGRSAWWALVLLPYPIAWVLGLVSGIRLLRRPKAS
jgi:hypothetical protein